MKPHELCKKSGLKSFREMCEISGKSEQTLINWYKKDRKAFDIMLAGCAAVKRESLVNKKSDQSHRYDKARELKEKIECGLLGLNFTAEGHSKDSEIIAQALNNLFLLRQKLSSGRLQVKGAID